MLRKKNLRLREDYHFQPTKKCLVTSDQMKITDDLNNSSFETDAFTAV